MDLFEHVVDISFGDCDAALLVYYPNYFRWMDATFHAFLKHRAGGHSRLCERLSARGLGLMESRLRFLAPAFDCDRLTYRMQHVEWAERSFAIDYVADVDGRLVLEGQERRGVFVMKGDRMTTANVDALRRELDLCDPPA